MNPATTATPSASSPPPAAQKTDIAPPSPDKAPSILDYSDYRVYLRDYYAYRKGGGAYSFAMFSKRAGLASPNYLKLVMDGERNLTDRNIRLFAKALGLGTNESEYFENLVRYNQAETPAIKTHYFEVLSAMTSRRRLNVFELQRENYEILSKWHLLPLMELARCKGFREEGAWISRRMGRAITPKEAEDGLKLLERHGLLQRDPQGRLQPGTAAIRCESLITNLALRQFHKSMLGRVVQAIDQEPVERRNLRSLTLAIATEDFPAVIDELREFISQLNAKYSRKAEQPEHAEKLDTVCQIAVQTMLLTARVEN